MPLSDRELQTLRNMGNECEAAADEIVELRAIIAELSARQEPVAWLVLDKSGYVMHAASWEQAAHDHINDAINEHDLKEAADWIVRPCYTTPPLPEAPDTVRVPREPTPDVGLT